MDYKLYKRTEDLTGRVFGKLTVLSFIGYKINKNKSKKAQWLCMCKCGRKKSIDATSLKTGNTKSCGDCNPINVGDKFGKLIVITSAKYIKLKNRIIKAHHWCKCTCGNKKLVLAGSLKTGKTKSCGDCNSINIGDVFGKLLILKVGMYKTLKNKKRVAQCLCKCECGNEKTILSTSLKGGYTKSCGNCNPIKIGDKFGKLTVLSFAGYKKQKCGRLPPYWVCQCACGNQKTILESSLKSNKTKSYGCLPTAPSIFYSKKYNCKFDSSWELNFVKILEYLEIKWQREPKIFNLSNNKRYKPDFYLPEFNMFIEIKGRWYKGAKEKTELFKKEYPEYNYYVIDKLKYKEIEKHFKFLLK